MRAGWGCGAMPQHQGMAGNTPNLLVLEHHCTPPALSCNGRPDGRDFTRLGKSKALNSGHCQDRLLWNRA